MIGKIQVFGAGPCRLQALPLPDRAGARAGRACRPALLAASFAAAIGNVTTLIAAARGALCACGQFGRSAKQNRSSAGPR